MRRFVALLVLATVLAVPVAARAQSSPFSPLPAGSTPAPAPTATPAPVADQSSVSRPMLLGIAGAVLLLFVAIGVYIARDARRNLTEADRRALERGEDSPPRPAAERRQAERSKQRNRARTRAQKQARKKQRR